MPAFQNEKVSQKIIAYIQELILNGELKLGDKLPSERQLSQQFNVGRPSVREALSALEVIGLTGKHHGQGNYITHITSNNYLKNLAVSFKLDNGKNTDILELRSLVEPFAAGAAARRNDGSQIPRLYQLHQALSSAETLSEKAGYDRDLHLEIAKLSKNQLLVNLFLSVSYLFDLYTRNTIAISITKSSLEDIYQEHLSIIRAIEAHDETAASACMAFHLSRVEDL